MRREQKRVLVDQLLGGWVSDDFLLHDFLEKIYFLELETRILKDPWEGPRLHALLGLNEFADPRKKGVLPQKRFAVREVIRIYPPASQRQANSVFDGLRLFDNVAETIGMEPLGLLCLLEYQLALVKFPLYFVYHILSILIQRFFGDLASPFFGRLSKLSLADSLVLRTSGEDKIQKLYPRLI